MKTNRLFRRDFTIMVIGQIISLFGNAILRFALSLYVLDLTGSAAAFGGILALSMIPTIFISPFGGILADRIPRQKIMWGLDFITATLIGLFALGNRLSPSLAMITVVMMALSVIQACYQPSVQASIPSLVAEEHLMAANGVVVQVQALANLLGPIIGGFLYGILVPRLGLLPILIASGVCFFISAVMELFLHIPFTRQKRSGSPLAQVRDELGSAFRFLIRENPATARLLVVVAGLNLFLAALFIVGLPFLVSVYLGLSAELYGFAQAALGCGSVVGGLLSGVFSKKVGLKESYRFLLTTSVLLLPIAVVLALRVPSTTAYAVIVACVLLGMAAVALFNVACMTFLQQQTPAHLMGKVSSFVTVVCTCALPIGQALYGLLFELFQRGPWPVVLFASLISVWLSFAAKKALCALKE